MALGAVVMLFATRPAGVEEQHSAEPESAEPARDAVEPTPAATR
jgi:hypothetical protein